MSRIKGSVFLAPWVVFDWKGEGLLRDFEATERAVQSTSLKETTSNFFGGSRRLGPDTPSWGEIAANWGKAAEADVDPWRLSIEKPWGSGSAALPAVVFL